MPRWLLGIPGNEPQAASEEVGRVHDSAELRTWTYPHELTIVRDDGRVFVWDAASAGVDDGTENSLFVAINNGGVGRYVFTPGPIGIGRKSAAPTALNADASTAVLVQVLVGWGASKSYICRFGMRVTIWKTATKSHSGNLDCTIDGYVTTDGAGVATVAFSTTPYFDPSLLVAGLVGAAATVVSSAGGFTVSATRVAGIASAAEAEWWCVTREDIT